MISLKDDYKSMLFGAALFFGGVVACLILTHFFKNNGSEALSKSVSPSMAHKVLEAVPVLSAKPVLEDIRDELNVEKPMGENMSLSVNVTDELTELFRVNEGFPWSSLDITNNGPDPVFFAVNYWYSPEAGLPVGQTISIDYKKRGSIKKVYLQCARGENSNVSLFVVR